ncbi:MAG: tryptophan 7-halogenase [Thermoanaerobaculia bacterium]|nr:tryptophan 7-halogenase [Thermoanaerobaculia bacterium]
MTSERYDVVILGGAFSGAAAATLLRRERPSLRVLVVEKQEQFDQKVGEATTEMSGMFITRRLGLWQHLEMEHLPKEGLRYWFSNEKVTGHANASESGAFYRSTVPSFQLRRDVLDEHMLETAVAEGAELLRPAKVKEVVLGDFDNRVLLEKDGEEIEVEAKWVIDATGRVAFVGRKLGIIDRNEDHPVAAMWARFNGVRHIDDLAARQGGVLRERNIGSRRLSTNHYVGLGYWIWVIPLGNGETSIGIVWDKRLVKLHESRDREHDFDAFLRGIPALAELLEGADFKRDDFRFYAHLPYVTRQYMGNGWALVGDAAAFLDPYYSPGLDHCSFSVEATVNLLVDWFDGKDVAMPMKEHNETFLRSYHHFFEGIYRDKYYYMGEHDLMAAATMIDTAQYYIFVVMPAYRIFKKFHWMPVLGPKQAVVSYAILRAYNRSFKRLALLRQEMGVAGRRNDGRRLSYFFNLGLAPMHMLMRGLKLWLYAELEGLGLLARKMLGGKRAKPKAADAMPDPGLGSSAQGRR